MVPEASVIRMMVLRPGLRLTVAESRPLTLLWESTLLVTPVPPLTVTLMRPPTHVVTKLGVPRSKAGCRSPLDVSLTSAAEAEGLPARSAAAVMRRSLDATGTGQILRPLIANRAVCEVQVG